MSFKQWKSILELNKKDSDLTDDGRVDIIVDRLETWSTKNCFHRLQQSKNCRCLSFLNSPVMEVEAPNLEINRSKEAVASYILAWSKMERIPQKMLLMEKNEGCQRMEENRDFFTTFCGSIFS